MLTQLVSRPTRRRRGCAVTLPRPSTRQARQSEPHDQRLPAEARMTPCVSPRLIAGVPEPTGNFFRPPLDSLSGDKVTTTPATTKTTAATTSAILSFGQNTDLI